MRKRFYWKFTAAGQVWPGADNQGGPGRVEPFNWVKIENRDAANAVRMGFEPTIKDDPAVYYASIPAGKVRIFNVAGKDYDPLRGDAWPHELYVLSVGGGSTVMIEIADSEISDIDQSI